ncbi:PEP/pyruvate-binding domain-containing protein [Kitasatospora sp. SUK 42]|uniref:PEP/pyruvate-binding domain-containing protein n=1 Tax=Kitasatospora sp. SUK 42 TaxID=1588882 RepID=UPI0018CB6E56|nr:PEP/pyruvate-binding domain-containing protein [Kitasatospora sp. SUK 42]MBV2156631.1 phosphoenolpyruvate synthase [Kitasatospora sp. SUK 42]
MVRPLTRSERERADQPSARSRWLAEDGAELADPELVGHKFARQAMMAETGFPVPPLVCVPAPVFDQVVGDADARPEGPGGAEAWSPAELTRRAEELRRQVQGIGLPEPLRQALADRFDELAGPDGLVAVRACVVPQPGEQGGEDSAQDPFAGLSSSFLYVRRAELADRVVDCWASAFNTEAVLYRARRGLAPFAARVAVGVQRMAMGTRSFVAFTQDPRDGSARCVIAAAHGIGEGVVQEKADVDHFFVEPRSRSIEAQVVAKSRAVGWDPERPDEGPVPLTLDERQAGLPVLTDDEVHRITAMALDVQEYFGVPQDIEGTITADGGIHLVQARPIAAPPRPAAPEGGPVQAIVWDNNNVTESFPHVSCALTYSVARELYEVGFTDLYRRMGVSARTLRGNRSRLRRMVGHLDGRVYYRLDSWYRLHGQIRCFRPLWSTWEQSLGLAPDGGDRPAAKPGGRWRTRLANTVHLTEIAGRFAAHPLRVRGFVRWWDEYHERLADASELPPHEALEAYQELWTEVGRRWGVTLVNGVFLFTASWATNSLLRRWLPGSDRNLLNGMLVGGPDNRSAAALNSAIALAETVAATPGLRDAVMAEREPQTQWEELTEGRHGAEFGEALREHVHRYGDRGMHDLKLEAVTPREEPWTVLNTVRAFVRQNLTVEANRATGRDIRRRAEEELRERCRNPLKRTVLKGLFGAMRSLMRIREDTRFCRSQLFGDTRTLLMNLGTGLAETGRLDKPTDIHDLTVDEVLGAFDGTLPGADLRGLAAVRAAERARWSTEENRLPVRLETDPRLPLALALASVRGAAGGTEATATPGAAAAPGMLTGLASSSGTVRGRAKVVLDPSTTAEECEGRILVARETDPGWLFLMMSAKALVVERGTLLSHTAITGRLLGIPTVVAVPGATSLIEDGSLVEVDGAAGTVRILDGAS